MFIFQTSLEKIRKKDVVAVLDSKVVETPAFLKQDTNTDKFNFNRKSIMVVSTDKTGKTTKKEAIDDGFSQMESEFTVTDTLRKRLKESVNKSNKSDVEKKEINDELDKEKTAGGMKNILERHGLNDLAREFINWVQQNYEETRKKLLGSKIKLRSPSPSIIRKGVETTDKFVNDGTKASEAVAKEYSPLNGEKGGADNTD